MNINLNTNAQKIANELIFIPTLSHDTHAHVHIQDSILVTHPLT